MQRAIAIAVSSLVIASGMGVEARAASRNEKILAGVAGGLVATALTTAVVDAATQPARQAPPAYRPPRPAPRVAQATPVHVDDFGNHYRMDENGRRIYVEATAAQPAGAVPQQPPVSPAPHAPTLPPVDARPATAAPAVNLAAIEARALELVNRHRASRGLRPLASDPQLSALAREHSARMASGAVPVGHDGFSDRVARSGRRPSAAENVAYTTETDRAADAAVEFWLGSGHHRENIEDDRSVSGIGAARSPNGDVYLTQLFF